MNRHAYARWLAWSTMTIASVGCGGGNTPAIVTHPVFHTTISGRSRSRPAIQVDIKDDSEGWVFTAELYLTVQSSRFPNDTWVMLPLNVGDFAGCRTRFVQLPFEVTERDVLLFNLLDEDDLTKEQEDMLINGCRATGYCLLAAGSVYSPPAEPLIRPLVPIAADLLGKAILNDVAMHQFTNRGTAEFIVPGDLPVEPQQANELSVRDSKNYVPVVLKLYGPATPLSFTTENLTAL